MSQVIFCKTRYQDIGYHSYSDLWRMVELSGYKIIYIDQLDPQSDNTYIVTPLNDEWLQGWDNPRARIIHYELEWRIDWRADVNTPKGVAETWAADKAYAERIGARYVPMGGDERLNLYHNASLPHMLHEAYDVSQLSYQTPRRQMVTQQLRNQRLTLAPSEQLWGEERSKALMQSRLMLHIHQREDTRGVAPLRWCLAAAHKLPLLTESVPDYGIFNYSYMMQANYGDIAGVTANVVRDERRLQEYAGALYRLLCCDYTFKRSVDSHV